jgi:hypothetical protein
MKLTYAITACNEHVELERLLRFLKKVIRVEDEVIIQLDTNHTTEVLEVCNLFTNFNHEGQIETCEIKNSKFFVYPLDNDFGRFKNNLTQNATGDFIFQIDADEYPSETLIEHLPSILEANPDNEVYLVPRINTVDGLTQEHVAKWGWNVDFNGFVNFPDYQWRIYKRTDNIKWINKVHERLDGFKMYGTLPAAVDLCLLHHKTIEKQEKQNNFYDKL